MRDRVDALADKMIEAFEPFSDTLLLEQIAIPEDPDDPRATIDLWLVGAETEPVGDEAEEAIVLRGTASVPTGAVRELDAGKLTALLRDGILDSPEFREAKLTARVASAGTRRTGLPSKADASRN